MQLFLGLIEFMIFLTTIFSIKNDWTTYIFIIILTLLAVAKWIYKEQLISLLTIFFSKDYFLKYGKNNQLIFNGFNTILFVIQGFVISLLIVCYQSLYNIEILDLNGLQLFSSIFFITIIFFGLRYIIGKVLASIFELTKEHEYLTFSKISYLYSIIVIILPFIFLSFYTKIYNFLLFQLTIVIFSILLIIRYINILINNKNLIFSRLFYFILYLCALEIAPILLIYKILV